MSDIMDVLINIQNMFEEAFHDSGILIENPILDSFNQDGWINLAWTSDRYRKACISVIDASSSRGLWMMHCCIFPHYHNPAPIFGFDVFAGKSKITGCFHDFSPVVNDHPLSKWFADQSKQLSWNRQRPLPDWAKRIFSEDIIAAGNIKTDEELEQISKFIISSLNIYIDTLIDTNNTINDTEPKHTSYCENQRLNPHNPTILKTFGLSDEQVQLYINQCLFPIN
jgi:hypothetical protein